jgi:hypothetical protein
MPGSTAFWSRESIPSDVSRVQLIFMRPYAVPRLLLILGTVLGGICLIGGIVFTALQYSGKL